MTPSRGTLATRSLWGAWAGAGTLAVVAALALLVPGPSAHPASAPSAAPDAAPAHARPNILLFTIDTVRADHVSSYGYGRPTTPVLDGLAARGTRFERAYATASWTAPSVASIMTGLLPSEHGVVHARVGEGDSLEQEILSDELPLLSETLRAAGYRTVGVSSNGHMARTLGFARGFEDYECLAYLDLPDLRRAVASHVAAMRAEPGPFFLWVHVLDPHAPYRPTSPSFDAFWPAERPQYAALDDIVFPELLELLMSETRMPEALAYVEAAYDSEIATTDAYLGELVRDLDDGNLAIVVTADHGEEFEDHWRMGHGHTLYEEVIRVPLVVALPGAANGTVVRTPVSLIDVFPTLAEIAGAVAPPGLAGRSLVPSMRGAPAEARPVYAEIEGDEAARAIVDGELKYVVHDEPSAEALFDVVADPRERLDLLAGSAERAAELRRALDATLALSRARRPAIAIERVRIEDEERARLRALGYAR